MKYGLAILGVLGVAILAIVLITAHGPKPSGTQANKAPVKLVDYDNQIATLSLTTQGRLVGEDQHRSIRISITPTERRIEILDGYEETVERDQSYSNSQAAYQTFLRALSNAGFIKSHTSSISDYRGVCPLGFRYIYDLSDGLGQHVSNLWSDSCTNGQGTFAGSPSLIRQLFQAQIPDYNKQVAGVNL